jgi:hypothetical protein
VGFTWPKIPFSILRHAPVPCRTLFDILMLGHMSDPRSHHPCVFIETLRVKPPSPPSPPSYATKLDGEADDAFVDLTCLDRFVSLTACGPVWRVASTSQQSPMLPSQVCEHEFTKARLKQK